jgi:glycosyltransferase involved in cell wall biosynthesis
MNSPKLKIYYAWNYFEWGGAQIYFFGLIRRIKDNADICVVLPEGSDEQLLMFIDELGVSRKLYTVDNYEKYAPTLIRKARMHLQKLKAERRMIAALRTLDLKGAIVHVELAPWQSLYSLAALCLRSNVFITMHNSFPPVPKWRKALWKAKFAIITRFQNFHIFASNEDAKKSLREFVPDDFYDRIDVTFTNVNPDEVEEAMVSDIETEKYLQRYNIPKNKFLVFCVGQFIDRKGRWTFLEAARNVLQEDEDFAFVWISNSRPSPEDLAKTESYGLGENLVLITSDQVGGKHVDLFRLMRIADVFALASFQEGLPISLLEAMALEIPSISTNVNAIPEAVKHLETGWLIEAGDAPELARAITVLKADVGLRKKLSENGRRFVLANFNERVVAKIAFDRYSKSVDR